MRHHDHVFVQAGIVEQALTALERLAGGHADVTAP